MKEKQASLRRLLSERASLNHEHPLRREVEKLVTQEGGELEKEWLDLLKADEVMRLELQKIDIPPGLEKRLHSIADPTSSRSPFSILVPHLRWTVALGSLVAMAGIFFVLSFQGQHQIQKKLETLALLAINDHLNNENSPRFEAVDTQTLKTGLAGKISFSIEFPNLDPGYRFLGGHKCVLGGHPVVYSLWSGPGGKASLFQFEPSAFELENLFTKHAMNPSGPMVGQMAFEVEIWSEGANTGYIFVQPRSR